MQSQFILLGIIFLKFLKGVVCNNSSTISTIVQSFLCTNQPLFKCIQLIWITRWTVSYFEPLTSVIPQPFLHICTDAHQYGFVFIPSNRNVGQSAPLSAALLNTTSFTTWLNQSTLPPVLHQGSHWITFSATLVIASHFIFSLSCGSISSQLSFNISSEFVVYISWIGSELLKL